MRGSKFDRLSHGRCSRHETQHLPRLRLAPVRAHPRFRAAVAELLVVRRRSRALQMNSEEELQQHLHELEARKAASVTRVRTAGAILVALLGITAIVSSLVSHQTPTSSPPLPTTPTPTPTPSYPPTTPAPRPTPPLPTAEPLLTGNHIVALFGISVVGLLVYGAFSFGRVVTISFEISNTKKLLRINAGKSINPTRKSRNA